MLKPYLKTCIYEHVLLYLMRQALPVTGWSKDLGPTDWAGSLSAVFIWSDSYARIKHIC